MVVHFCNFSRDHRRFNIFPTKAESSHQGSVLSVNRTGGEVCQGTGLGCKTSVLSTHHFSQDHCVAE